VHQFFNNIVNESPIIFREIAKGREHGESINGVMKRFRIIFIEKMVDQISILLKSFHPRN
jgi:hypothetical protein